MTIRTAVVRQDRATAVVRTKFTASKPVIGRPVNTLPFFDANRLCGLVGVEVSVRSIPTQPAVPIGWMFDARFELRMLVRAGRVERDDVRFVAERRIRLARRTRREAAARRRSRVFFTIIDRDARYACRTGRHRSG